MISCGRDLSWESETFPKWSMMLKHEVVEVSAFNPTAKLPFQLRLKDFEIAMQDVYDFFYDVNRLCLNKGLPRLDDELRPAIMSGMLSDMLTASMAKHSRSLTQNRYHNGHPDLIVKGRYPNDGVKAGTDGVEIKTTRQSGGLSIRTEPAISVCASSSTMSIAKLSRHRIVGQCVSPKSISVRSLQPISARIPGACWGPGRRP